MPLLQRRSCRTKGGNGGVGESGRCGYYIKRAVALLGTTKLMAAMQA